MGRVINLPVMLLVVGLGIITAVLFVQSGSVLNWLSMPMPPGQIPYLLSKWMGLSALWFWQLQLFMQYGQDKIFAMPPSAKRHWHRYLGSGIFIGALGHFLLFVTAVSIRNEHFAYKLFTFQFDGYYKTRVTFGLLTLIVLSVAVLPRLFSSYFQTSRLAIIHIVHRLSLPAYLLVLWHALTIGSESRDPMIVGMFSTLALLTGLLWLSGITWIMGKNVFKVRTR